MPLKVNVGLSRKVGESNYGSRGASVNVELELDSSLVGEPSKLQDKVRQLFGLLRTSLEEELNGHSQPASPNGANGHANGHAGDKPNGNGQANGPTRPATQSQLRAIYAIAKKRQFDLKPPLQERFRVGRPDDLSIKDASALIDELNQSPGNNGG